jgi:hypothetical protein
LTAGLTAAGAVPVDACVYEFGIDSLHTFITLSTVLEGVGTSAYLGAAPAISSKTYLGIAGSILAVEAQHTSLQRFALGYTPIANPFYPAIDPNSAYSLASAFIKSCPSTNAALPFKAFPALTLTSTAPLANSASVSFSIEGDLPAGSFVTFVSGLDTVSVAATGSGSSFSAVLPAVAEGQTYAFVTSANVTAISDSTVLFGPSIVEVTPPVPTLDYATS